MHPSSMTPKLTSTRWWVMLAVAVCLLSATYVLAVLTPLGQAFENAALAGADQVSAAELTEADSSLDAITIWSLGVATLVVAAIGLLRKQFLLTGLAVGVIVMGQVITQSLKRFILPRPELVEVTGNFTGNSFPSGHTTIAMTVMVATFLVIPYRYRGIAMFLVLPWASGIGAYTLTAKWHRLSDTLGADMVALALGAVAALILLRAGRIERAPAPRFGPLRVTYVVLVSMFAATTAFLGTFLAAAALSRPLVDPVIQWDAYLAATSLATAGSLLTALAYWASWRRLQEVSGAS